MVPSTMRPGGCGIRRMTESAVTLLPEPDSPTMPSVSPLLMWNRSHRRRGRRPRRCRRSSTLDLEQSFGHGAPCRYHVRVISAKASRVRAMSSASMSLWVTHRIEADRSHGSSPCARRIPRPARPWRPPTRRDPPRSTFKMTMFVCTLARSTRSPKPGQALGEGARSRDPPRAGPPSARERRSRRPR